MEKASAILDGVARLANVPALKRTQFLRLVRIAIASAHRESSLPRGKRISAGALTKDFFNPIIRAAKALQRDLERLQGEYLDPGEAPRAYAACAYFSEGLQALSRSGDASDPIAHFLGTLDLGSVIAVAEHVRKRAASEAQAGPPSICSYSRF